MGESHEDVELEIKRTREALAEKVDALLDEVSQGAEEVRQGAEKVKEGVDSARKAGVQIAVVVFVGIMGALLVRRLIVKSRARKRAE
ncbi:MAG: hypothetical protein M3164_04315 [Actinomycetota bacterium]|nr:hypothetical protein [Actinomycetota bacterium]